MSAIVGKTLISIVIPAYNEAAGLEHTLNRIRLALDENRDESFAWEIVVCDNNSTDDTAEIARQAGAYVVFEPINQISRARNTGAAAARGEWLLFIDADSYPRPGTIDDVLTLVHSGDYIGCGTTVAGGNGPLWSRLRLERLNPLFRLFNWCGGAFILCRAQAFGEIGGFSTDLYALEEVDFVVRLKRHGRRRGKKFTVLHRHPVVTSARKGRLSLKNMVTLAFSTAMSVVLLVLHFVLPSRWRIRGGRRVLGFWYDARGREE